LRGTVYHHSKFGFHDGGVGKKYIILLNSPQTDEPYLFVKVTSQQDGKPTTPGCIISRKLFFMPFDGKHCFKLNTWVQLHELYEFSPVGMVKFGMSKEMTVHGKITPIVVNQIVNCYIKSNGDDLLPKHRTLLSSSKASG
jgi:hypothetical protein